MTLGALTFLPILKLLRKFLNVNIFHKTDIWFLILVIYLFHYLNIALIIGFNFETLSFDLENIKTRIYE